MHRDFDIFQEFNQSEILRRFDSPIKDNTYEDFPHKDIYIAVVTTTSKMAITASSFIHMVDPIKRMSTMVNPL